MGDCFEISRTVSENWVKNHLGMKLATSFLATKNTEATPSIVDSHVHTLISGVRAVVPQYSAESQPWSHTTQWSHSRGPTNLSRGSGTKGERGNYFFNPFFLSLASRRN